MKYTNKLELPQAFVNAVDKEYKFTPHRYSVTTLQGGACKTYLQRLHDEEMVSDVSDYLWAIFGSAVHELLEKHAEEGTSELRMEMPVTVGKYDAVISGILDVHREKGVIEDYKTGSIWRVVGNDWRSYEEQITGYAVLYEHNTGEKIEKGRIIFFMKDWNKREYRKNKELPPSPIHVHEFDITEQMKALWLSDAKEKISQLEYAFESGNLPMECSRFERLTKPRIYAVKKKTTDAKSMKNFTSLEEAQNYSKDGIYLGNVIEVRPEENPMCEDYCPVSEFCPYHKERMKNQQNMEYIEKIHKDKEKVE